MAHFRLPKTKCQLFAAACCAMCFLAGLLLLVRLHSVLCLKDSLRSAVVERLVCHCGFSKVSIGFTAWNDQCHHGMCAVSNIYKLRNVSVLDFSK